MTFPNDPNNNSRNGRLVVPKETYNAHISGEADNHKAKDVVIDPVLNIFGSVSNVQQALTNASNYFATLVPASPEGFTTVGDGYNTYYQADGNINYSANIPSIDTLLNPVFQSILAGNPLPGFERLKNGGILVVKSGTYTIADTIEIPPGITLLGEGVSTRFVNITNLDFTGYPITPPQQNVVSTTKPLFRILQDENRVDTDAAYTFDAFAFARATKIINCVICDNFFEPTILGDIYYKLPQNKTINKPLIVQNQGSNLILDGVYLLGRVVFTSTPNVNSATSYPIQLDNSNIPIIPGTFLTVRNCVIDGFSIAGEFKSIEGSNAYLKFNNNLVRVNGNLNSNPTLDEFNSCLTINTCNADINDNYIYLYKNQNCLVYLFDVVSGSVPVQGRSKITVCDNTVSCYKLNNTNLTTYPFIASATALAAPTKWRAFTLNNKFDENFYIGNDVKNITTDSQIKFSSTSIDLSKSTNINGDENLTGNLTVGGSSDLNGATFINNKLKVKITNVSTSLYTLLDTDNIILVNTTSNAITISLPNPTLHNNRVIYIKDTGGNLITNNLILARFSSEKIDGLTANKTFIANYGSWQIVCDGVNWWIL